VGFGEGLEEQAEEGEEDSNQSTGVSASESQLFCPK